MAEFFENGVRKLTETERAELRVLGRYAYARIEQRKRHAAYGQRSGLCPYSFQERQLPQTAAAQCRKLPPQDTMARSWLSPLTGLWMRLRAKSSA